MRTHARLARWRALASLVAAVAAVACEREVRRADEPESAACALCHREAFAHARTPQHAGALPTTCASCHDATAWHPARLRHGFALRGKHEQADCFACHRGDPPRFEGTPRACAACHATAATPEPFAGHAAFGHACERCHDERAWRPARLTAPAVSARVALPAPRPAASGR